MNIYARNYKRLEKIIPDLRKQHAGDAMELEASGFMALHFDCLQMHGSAHFDCETDDVGDMRISLAHYFEQNGDLCADPDMEIRVAWKDGNGIAEALTFQQAMPPVYQVVYPEPGKMYPTIKKELNSFLELWLVNLINQGHKLKSEAVA